MIGVTRDGHVMTLEMQRAERRNALNSELVDSLREADREGRRPKTSAPSS